MTWEDEKRGFVEEITPKLYQANLIETIFNAKNEKYREKGWTLKSGIWSPWFLNLRPIGKDPRLLADVSYALVRMFEEEMPECDRIVGVEMAGIPIATATSMISLERRGKELPFCYTRPLPVKVRTPAEAEERLKKYGEKSLVEGEILDNDNLAIWDDMVTNMGSKLIARSIILYEVKKQGLEGVQCYHVGVLLDREQSEKGAAEQAKEAGMELHSLIPFSQGLPLLANAMRDEEFELVSDYLKNHSKYQGLEPREYVLRERRAFNP